MVIRSLIILFITSSSLFAQGGMFGFSMSPCPEGGIYNVEHHHCMYCPQGAQLITEPSSKRKRCSGIAALGNPCPTGQDVWFDDQNNVCLYCSPGYAFSYNHKECYP